jgi:hypothetical protein
MNPRHGLGTKAFALGIVVGLFSFSPVFAGHGGGGGDGGSGGHGGGHSGGHHGGGYHGGIGYWPY